MKSFKYKILVGFFTIGVLSYSASIDHIQNYTAEYGANPAQQGAINTGSSVFFNPAGLTRLENGIYFVGGAQYAFGKQKMSYNGKNYDTDMSSPIPNLALYKVKDKNAFFFTFGALGGGAELHYKHGVPLSLHGISLNKSLDSCEVKGSNLYAQTTIGTSYYLTDKWSASIALRGVYGKRTLKAKANLKNFLALNNVDWIDVDSKREAYGVGAQFGLNYAATDKLNIGFRYDTKINLKFKTKENHSGNGGLANLLFTKYPVYRDGQKIRRDLPAILALGASYKVSDKWTTFLGGNYYFNESAKMDRIGTTNVDYHNGWEISLGSEYWLNNKIAWLVGFNYADTGAPRQTYAATEYALNSKMVGTGFKYKPLPDSEITLAYNHYFYDTNTTENIKYKKEISSIGLNFVQKL